jgi:vacuolar protein sorting-associated protein 13A/C
LFSLLKLPFEIKHSNIKKLNMRIPSLLNPFSEPVELSLETVLIVLGPLHKNQWQHEKSWSLSSKMELLKEFIESMAEKILDQKKLVKAGKDVNAGGKDSKAEDGYWFKKIIKVIDNVQVTVKNIHIRYEDELTIKDKPFSMGFTLKELSANTTNDKWQVEFFDRLKVSNRNKSINKALNISGFAFYINPLD